MKKHSENYKNELVEILRKISHDRQLLKGFLEDIFTKDEFETISVRWQIVKRIAKGERHRDIAEDLGLGVATVTRGSKEMKEENGGFKKVLRFLDK